MNYVQRLVGRVRGTQRNAIPLQPRAALEVLDAIGCILRGVDHPMVQRASDGTRDPIEQAVLMRSMACHVDEFDSIHPVSATVPAAVVVPAALSVAESLSCSGQRILEAVQCGYDVLTSVAIRFGGPMLYERSWWPTSTFGALGAAAAVGVLLELDDDQLANALGIAASSVGGLLSDDSFGDGHYLAAAEAAAYGAHAALRAARGMTASSSLLDGPASRAFGTPTNDEPVGGGVAGCVFKWYPCARPLHGVVEGLVLLRRNGVDLASLSGVEVAVHPNVMRFLSADAEVGSPADAAASLAFATCATVRGRESDPAFFREARASWNGPAPSFLLVPSPAGHFSWESRLTCTSASGEVYEVLGTPDESIDPTRLRDKFFANASAGGLDQPAAADLYATVLDLPTTSDAGKSLASLMRPDQS